jgi:hypothetical protein
MCPRLLFDCEKTMKRDTKFPVVFALCVAVALTCATEASAQCSTCPQPVVAFSPVVAPATTVTTFQPVDTGWYPGRMFDTWRMRRWGYTNPTAVTTVAPTWSTAMPVTAAMPVTTMMPITTTAIPQTVGFAPMATTTFATPHITSFAPLGQRQVLMRPVIVQSPVVTATPVISSGCSACSACEVAAPCSSCAAAAPVVEQATFATPAAPAPCSNCAQGSQVIYSDTSASVGGSQIPQPELAPGEGVGSSSSNYPNVEPPKNPQYTDPGPKSTDKASESTYLEPPALYIPGDRTAQHDAAKPVNRAPSVNVWNAVYREPINVENTSTSTGKSQAEIDAEGWSSVPAN